MPCPQNKICWSYKVTTVSILLFNLFVNDLYSQTTLYNSNEPFAHYKSVIPDTDQIITSIKKGYAISITNFDSGIHIIKEALSESIHYKYYNGIFEANLALGVVYVDKGEIENTRQFYQQALFYTEKTSRIYLNLSRVLNNQGNIYMLTGKYQEAAKYFYNAAIIVKQDTSNAALIQSATIYNNMAGALLRTKEYKSALQYLTKSEKIRIKSHTREGLTHIYNNKATIYKRLKNVPLAKEYFEKALTVATEYNNEQSKAVAKNGLAEILIMNGEYNKAIPLLETLLQSKSNINPYYKETGPLFLLGNAYLQMKRYPQAEKYFLEALNKAKALHIHDHILKTNQYLTELYATTRDYYKAYTHLKDFMTYYDSSLNQEKTEAIGELEVRYRTVEKDRKILEDQLLIKKQSEKISATNRWIVIFFLGSIVLVVIAFLLYRTVQSKRRLQEATIRDMEQQQEINTLKAIMQGEEKERTRIAQELHDGIGGTLAAVKMNFTAVQNDHAFLEQVEGFQYAMNLLNDMSNELRHTAHNLMPEMLMQYGLPEAMRVFCLSIKKGNELTIEFQTYGTFENLSNDFTLYVYRIMQELIHNIVKHSKATHAIVQLSHYENLLTIAVEDNGQGFSDMNKGNGMGLINLQSRVNKLNGVFTIETSEQKGTAIYIEFDLQNINTEVA